MRSEKGFALVLTLIVTTLMVAVLVEMIHQIYVDVSLSRGFRDGQQASLLAESGITGATKLLQMAQQGKNYTSLTDMWAAPIKLDDETGTIEITIVEESGKLCINDLVQTNGAFEPPNTLAALKLLGKRLQIQENVWYALADWMDGDDSTRSNGAESPYYQTLKPPYVAHNAKLATIDELSLVRGFTPEYITALRPFVTVYSSLPGAQSPVNINTASKEVLAALDEGIDDRMAERILEERRLKPFQNLGELGSRIPGAGAISQNLIGKVSVRGTLFRITSVARVKETARTVEAVVRVDGGQQNILSWQEY
jgi:general secretion pathway protein K